MPRRSAPPLLLLGLGLALLLAGGGAAQADDMAAPPPPGDLDGAALDGNVLDAAPGDGGGGAPGGFPGDVPSDGALDGGAAPDYGPSDYGVPPDSFGSSGLYPAARMSPPAVVHRSAAGRCDPVSADALDERGLLHASDGQDRCLLEHYFPGVCGGRYLEVGALDGVRYSNTYAFYASPDLGWRGVNVEIDPKSYERLASNRKNDIANVHAAVCSSDDPAVIASDGVVHYAPGKLPSAGGLWEYATEEKRARWWGGTTIDDAVAVRCTELRTILDRTVGTTGSQYFDFATVAVEGAELSALRGLDFGRAGFGVILVRKQEGRDEARGIEELLGAAGYDKVDERTKTCGFRDDWFINRDFERIYEGYRLEQESAATRSLRG